MSDTAAGQPSERTPDFIPGWFKRVQPGTQRPAAPTLDEAVRVLDDHAGVFPIAFLRSGEFVRPARPPQLGFVIGRMARDIELAVPPGYWLVRGDDGEIVLWRDDAFREKFSRRDDIEWRPAALRRGDFVEDKRGWRGTQPAEGTRRALVYGALLGEEVLTADECLAHADAIESSLLDCQIAVEAAATGTLRDNPHLPPEYAKRIVDGAQKIVSEREDEADAEIRDSEGNLLGGLEVVVGAADGIPYVSLADLEHVFANLYEDVTNRQARKHRGEATMTGTQEAAEGRSPFDQEREEADKLAKKREVEKRLGEEQRIDAEDDRALWKVELDYGLNHLRNAIADRLGL